MIRFFSKPPRKAFTIQHEDWTASDEDDMKMLASYPKFSALIKKLHGRINLQTEKLVNGDDTRARIDEISDILLELASYDSTED